MIRMLIGLVIQLASNLLGLIVAAAILDKFEVSTEGVVVATVIFTVVYAIAQPFFTQMAMGASALRGGVALIATLVGLIVTNLVTSDEAFLITGAVTWIEATVIVWIVSLIGVFILPLIFLKNRVEDRRGR